MTPTRQGSIRLFGVVGIDVFLHWSWFVLAWIEINLRAKNYSSISWNVLEYLALFAIVLMHEFGHALACRQVGGQANQIVLWPLGGVAYVDPPQRPGATLWSIAAGPLVNVVLLPILLGAWFLVDAAGWKTSATDKYEFIRAVASINVALLVFNLLPIFPLDGGQILRALLWFPLGRTRSLLVAAIIGFIGVAGLLFLGTLMLRAPALRSNAIWLIILSIFILMNCWRGLMVARLMARLEKAPRHVGFACPHCNSVPPVGPYWGCGKCRTTFDTFDTNAVCPQCGSQFAVTRCLDCGVSSPIAEWMTGAEAPPKRT